MTVMHISDEQLSAFLDGELDAEHTAYLEAALNSDPVLRQRLQALMQASSIVLEKYSAIDEFPIPAAVLSRLTDSPDQPSDDSTTFGSKLWALIQQPIPAAGAALAMLFGLLTGIFIMPQSDIRHDTLSTAIIETDHPFFTALDKMSSASSAPIIAGEFITPILSYQSAQGQYCREFTITTEQQQIMHAVACKNIDSWQIKVASFAVGNPAATDQYQTAGDTTAGPVESYISQHMQGDALGKDEELAIIDRQWHPKSQ